MTEIGAMLGRLMAQAQGAGADATTLRAIVEEASELGAERALARLGLSDTGAAKDVGELRQLLGAWRDAKSTARNAVVAWGVRVLMAGLLMALAAKLGLAKLLKG